MSPRIPKSRGHILFSAHGREFFDRGGEVYAAPMHLPIADVVNGTRHGRWEGSRAHFDLYRTKYKLPEYQRATAAELARLVAAGRI